MTALKPSPHGSFCFVSRESAVSHKLLRAERTIRPGGLIPQHYHHSDEKRLRGQKGRSACPHSGKFRRLYRGRQDMTNRFRDPIRFVCALWTLIFSIVHTYVYKREGWMYGEQCVRSDGDEPSGRYKQGKPSVLRYGRCHNFLSERMITRNKRNGIRNADFSAGKGKSVYICPAPCVCFQKHT